MRINRLNSSGTIKRFVTGALLCITIGLGRSSAQSCLERLEQASKHYEQGQFSLAIESVTPCLNTSDEELRWQLNRIAALSHIGLNQTEEARKAVVEMMRINPTYEADVLYDPGELHKLIQSVDVIPKFMFGINGNLGMNRTLPRISEYYKMVSGPKSYNGLSGYQLGVSVGYNFSHIHGLEMSMYSKTLEYEIDYSFNQDRIAVKEHLNSLDFPLTYRFMYNTGKRWTFLVSAGSYISVLYNSYNDLQIQRPEDSDRLTRYNSGSRRNLLNYGICGGIGWRYKLSKGYFSLDGQYNRALSSITKSDARFKDRTLIYDYYYIDDNIHLDNFQLNLGYSMYLNYKVRS